MTCLFFRYKSEQREAILPLIYLTGMPRNSTPPLTGDPTPRREDIEITKKLVESGEIIGIDLLDYGIIGDGRHFSLKEAGHI